MNLFLYGTIFACAVTATVFFVRFWKETKDELFLYFALCFALLSIERLALAFLATGQEYSVYLIRLFAFLVLIVAIVRKNRRLK